MKKTVIITAIILFTLSAFAQRSSEERLKHKTQTQKSETTDKRSISKDYNRSYRSPVTHTNPTQQSRREADKANGRREIARTYEKRGNVNNELGNSSARKPVNNHPGYEKDKHPRTHYIPQERHRVRQNHNNIQHYTPVRYNKAHIKYRVPNRINVYWTHDMYRHYRIMYPDFQHWYYPVGYRILTLPAYNAYMHFGKVRNVYGRVQEVWYSWSTDEYFLYFGGPYPYQDFTVVISGNHARRFSRHPEGFFQQRYIWVTGLVSSFEGKPEILVKRKFQIHLY